MTGSTWVVVVAGIFVLVVVVLVGLLVVGRLRGGAPDPDAGPPEHIAHPRGEAVPPTGSR
ncbi:MAG: hypothetical protein WBX27_15620 [Specibacter sp.]